MNQSDVAGSSFGVVQLREKCCLKPNISDTVIVIAEGNVKGAKLILSFAYGNCPNPQGSRQ
jgi:hypothetical protein